MTILHFSNETNLFFFNVIYYSLHSANQTKNILKNIFVCALILMGMSCQHQIKSQINILLKFHISVLITLECAMMNQSRQNCNNHFNHEISKIIHPIGLKLRIVTLFAIQTLTQNGIYNHAWLMGKTRTKSRILTSW